MKTFAKRAAITTGILLTALVCMGIVYIDTVQNYWYVNGGFVKLIVSNQTSQAIMTVDTNTLRVGFNTNNIARSFVVKGQTPPVNATGNGTSALTTGAVHLEGGSGGESSVPATATGGAGGSVFLQGGPGGNAAAATTNSTGGAGGNVTLTTGSGASSGSVATNAATGGAGGNFSIITAGGGLPSAAATNTVGGSGGTISITSGSGTTPSAGWARKSGNGGNFTFTAGGSGSSTRTNTGNAGSFTIAAGTSGNVLTSPGNPGTAGNINLTAGSGGTGDTNANGGRIYLKPGAATGSGAVDGDVVVGRDINGLSAGGLMVGPLLGGAVSITNILGASALLDFGSVAAGTVEDLLITVTGVTSNNVAVSLSVPWQSASGGGSFTTFNSNDVVYVRFVNNNLVTAIDPNPGVFTVVGFRIR